MPNKRSAVKEMCPIGCGKEFYPAGLAYHAKFCTGPGYVSSGTRSRPGRHDAKRKQRFGDQDGRKLMVLCSKGCGRELMRSGRVAHERHCNGPGYVPGYSQQRRQERRMEQPSNPSKLTVKSKAEPSTYSYSYAPINDVKMAYQLYPDDSAMFTAICCIAACKTEMSVEDQIQHLTRARDMLSLKIESLME